MFEISGDYLLSILQIATVNLALSGDNAMAIAMAARRVPTQRKRMVMIGGGVLAVLMQSAFALFVRRLILLPAVRMVGAVLLMGIACKLLQQEDPDIGGSDVEAVTRNSMLQIAGVNLVMSFDNVLAVASACRSDPVRMLIGLLLSVGIIFGFSSLITRAIARFPYIVYAGAFLLAATAAGMMWPALWAAFSGGVVATAGARLGLAYAARYTFTAVIVVMCLSSPRWWPTTP